LTFSKINFIPPVTKNFSVQGEAILPSLVEDSSISSFQQANEDLFPKRRLLNQRIREIRQKLMSHFNQQQQQQQRQLAPEHDQDPLSAHGSA
jgi:hypothetical protein